MRRARAVALLIPAILLAGSRVLADRPRVVVLGPSLQDATVARVREELTTLGFDVQIEVAGRDAVDLAVVARRFGAAAAARVEGPPPAIEVWVDPARSGGSGATESMREPTDTALLALRAVEMLRARLLPVPADERPAAPAASDAAAIAPAVDPGVAVTTPRPPASFHPVALLAGPAVLFSPGGVPASVHVRLGAEWNPWPRVGIEAMAYVPATSGTVSAAEGSMDLRVLDFGGGIRGSVTDPLSSFSVAVGLGLQAMRFVFEGRATPPWMDAHGSGWAASPYASVSAAYRLHPRFGLRLDIAASLVGPQPVLRVAGREVASFGQPAVFPSLGVEVRP